MSREIFGKSSESALTGLLTHYTRYQPKRRPSPNQYFQWVLMGSGRAPFVLVYWMRKGFSPYNDLCVVLRSTTSPSQGPPASRPAPRLNPRIASNGRGPDRDVGA